ncbi:ATP-grasp ribosomal peptide maturase [Nocardiopsis sp. NRRL B-16309]|uniref:ATP-grasp ribosomal peptide maturase n=1 Tax=Nocardiopsis sp. NRRL B-16309 TaxID=1519494 RepID=UPI0006AEE37D|nr:ATP-grasp ribosomal peptide maturase [Nocardiopsis sp. NRRL B-16309]
MTVLVLTQQLDPTADLVIRELHQRGIPVFRCDPGDFPEAVELEAHVSVTGAVTGVLRSAEREVDLEKVTSVYYRRPTPHRAHSRLNSTEQTWSEREAAAGFGGVVTTLGCRWVNHPHRNMAVAHKPHQLAAAARAGLTVPESLITNNADAARDFAEAQGKAVYKAMTGGPDTGGEARTASALYTTLVTADEITPGVARTAHLFQAWVDKACEVRLTVVGERLFAARIDARSAKAHVDWRADYRNLAYSPIEPPSGVGRAVHRLMSGLHLTFGALDFVVTPHGRWVFLELNPNGQWGWIQLATGQPIAAAIADQLQESSR